jgi:RimJ/RimL family protein N-acetyltransferase
MRSWERFETKRLAAQRVRESDIDFLYEMHRNPRLMETLGGVRSTAQTQAYLSDNIEHWERYGHGLWILRARDDNRFLGRAALRRVDVEGSSEIEVGYAVLPPYWGLGLATEVANAIIDQAFSRLGVDSLVSFALPMNAASQRVMEKAGGTYERDIVHAGLPHVLYRFVRRVGGA